MMDYFIDSSKLPKTAKIFNGLSLSGGGALGPSQLPILNTLEKTAQAKYGVKKLYEKMDIIAGSSVGSINGAMVAAGKYTVEEITTFYDRVLQQIFKKKSNIFKPFPFYDREVFRSEWINLFGKMKFGDVKTKLVITTFNRVGDISEFYKSWQPEYQDEPIEEVIMRSFAAAMYFGQYVDAKRKAVYFDGGMGIFNSPFASLKNEVEAMGLYEGDNHIMLHLIGCLFAQDQGNFADYKEDKKERTIKQVFDFWNPGSGGLARKSSMEEQLNMIRFVAKKKPNLNFKYYDYPIAPELCAMDKIDEKSQNTYKAAGRAMAVAPCDEVIHY